MLNFKIYCSVYECEREREREEEEKEKWGENMGMHDEGISLLERM